MYYRIKFYIIKIRIRKRNQRKKRVFFWDIGQTGMQHRTIKAAPRNWTGCWEMVAPQSGRSWSHENIPWCCCIRSWTGYGRDSISGGWGHITSSCCCCCSSIWLQCKRFSGHSNVAPYQSVVSLSLPLTKWPPICQRMCFVFTFVFHFLLWNLVVNAEEYT